MKTRCFFPQTITPEYDAIKKVEQCKDVSLPAVRNVDQMENIHKLVHSILFALYCVIVFVFSFLFHRKYIGNTQTE